MKRFKKLFVVGVIMILSSFCVPGCNEMTDYVKDLDKATKVEEDKDLVNKQVVEDEEPEPVSAKEWYHVAKEDADKWAQDTIFVGAVGDSKAKDGTALVVDGRTDQWSYQFVSGQKQKKLRVFVAKGVVVSQTEEDIGAEQGVKIEDFQGLIADDKWQVDSNDATDESNAVFTERNPGQEIGRASYILLNYKKQNVKNDTLTPMLSWTISYDAKATVTKVSVNAVSGEIIPD